MRLPFCFLPALVILLPLRAEPPVQLPPVEVTGTVPAYLLFTEPVTLTTYDGAFLKNAGITTYTELAPLVPGLFISEQSVANTSFNLRGITTDDNDPRGSQRVSIFQDNILLSNNASRNVALFDLERVDVLKGPQPATFSRGTQIGALSLITNRARNETSSELTAGFGTENERTASGYTNIPVVKDKLFARVAFTADHSDGYVRNLADGSDLEGRDTVAFRGSMRWQPSADTTADLIVNYQRDTPPGIEFKSMVIPTVAGDTNPYRPADLNRGSALGGDRSIVGLTGIVAHKLSDTVTVTSTTGWRYLDAAEEFDADGSQYYILEAGEYTQAREFSQELRFTYDASDRLRSSLGASVFWEKASQHLPFRSDENILYSLLSAARVAAGNPALPVLPPGALPSNYQESFTNYGQTIAADLFGDTSYKLTSKLTVGASARVSQEKLTSGYQSFATATPSLPLLATAGGGNSFFQPTNGRLQTSNDDTSWAGGVNARYELTSQHTAYASVSRGRRPPSTTYSQGAPFNTIELKEEIVVNYEAGFKGMLIDRRLSYNVAVFRYDYSNFQTQQTISPGVTLPTDGGRARGQGFETSLQGTVNDYVMLFGTYGFTDATFAAQDKNGQPQVYAGDTFRLTSRHTITLGSTFSLPLDKAGTFFVTPSWQYISGHYFEDNNQQAGGTLRQGGFATVNLRTGYRTHDNRWEVVFWVRNVFDKNYLIDAGNIGGQFGFPTSTRGEPRMAGVEVTARF